MRIIWNKIIFLKFAGDLDRAYLGVRVCTVMNRGVYWAPIRERGSAQRRLTSALFKGTFHRNYGFQLWCAASISNCCFVFTDVRPTHWWFYEYINTSAKLLF